MRSLRNSPWALGAAGGAVLLLGFLCGFTLFFPAGSLLPRLQAEGAKRGLGLSVGTLTTAFPLGIAAKDVIVSGKGLAAGGVKIDRLSVTPAWSRLLRGKAALAYEASLLGGRIEGVAERRGPLTLRGEELAWRGTLPGLSGGTLSTRLRAIELRAFWPPQAEEALHLVVAGEETKIEGLLGSKDSLLLGNVTLNASGKGSDLRLTTLSVSGGQLGIEGSGTILLNEPLGRSLLNLNLTLRGQSGLDPALAELLTAFAPPTADGTSRLRLTGTLASPQQSSTNR